jgi:ABC-type dipeptide/oligopeptide/nickel transport system permease component
VVMIAVGYSFANLFADILYAWLDPRISYQN